MRVIGAVEVLALAVLARAGVVAADDEMGQAVVPADDGMPQRLTRAAHAHGKVQEAQVGRGLRVLVQHRLIATHAGEVIDIARLGHADDRMDQEVGFGVAGGAEGQFLMGTVKRVAGLEGHDLAPAHLAKEGAQFIRRVAATLEVIMHRLLDAGDRTAQIDLAGRIVQVVHRRMRQIVGAKDLFGLIRLVRQPFVGDRQDRQNDALGIAQRDVLTGFDLVGKGLVHIQRDRHREQRAIGGAHVLDHAVIVGLAHEALQRVEAAVHQQLKVADLTLGQIEDGSAAASCFSFWAES